MQTQNIPNTRKPVQEGRWLCTTPRNVFGRRPSAVRLLCTARAGAHYNYNTPSTLDRYRALLTHFCIMSTRPWDIYAEQLFPSGYGHPLWKPEPNPTSGREVFIGDVGWLVEGEFRALFNSMKDADDPINQAKSVPRDYTVFSPSNLSIGRSDKITRSIVFSRSITADDAQAERFAVDA